MVVTRLNRLYIGLCVVVVIPFDPLGAASPEMADPASLQVPID
jgi:hypothetical protein